ncbi:MAG: hypothetical protein ABIV06_08130, partial [Thermoanaerobaculia bacterium]
REEEDAASYAAKLLDQVQSSYEETREENPTAPAPDALLMPWEEIAERLRNATRLDQLAIDSAAEAAPYNTTPYGAAPYNTAPNDAPHTDGTHTDGTHTDGTHTDGRRARLQPRDSATHIACQPAVEFRGRIQEWVAEVKRMRERGDTVLFVAASEGRA